MNKKTVKILSLALALCALLACVIGFSVSATETPTLDILSKNMVYGSNFKLAFAVDTTGVAADQTVEVLLYAEDPAVNPDTTAYKATLSANTVYEDTYPVYFSYGIPAKDLTSYVWAQAHIVGTETYGKVYRYSAVEYFHERLYTETADVTDAQAKLYNTCLTYCADAQAVLATTSPAIGDLRYVYVSGGTVDGVNHSALCKSGDVLSLVYGGTDDVIWSLKTIDAEGVISTSTANLVENITVADEHIIAEAVPNPVNSFESESALANYTISAAYEAPYFAASVADDPEPQYTGDKAFLVSQKFASGNSTANSIQIPVVGDTGNCYVFSYDLYWVNNVTSASGAATTTGSGPIVQYNIYAEGGSGASIRSNLNRASEDTKSTYGNNLVIGSGNGKGSTAYDYLATNLYNDKWYSIRMEIYHTGSAYITLYYVNDVLVAIDDSYNSSLSPLAYVSIDTKNNNADLYYDNVSFTRVDKAYVEPADTINGSPSATGIYFADDTKTGLRVDFTTEDHADHGITKYLNLGLPVNVGSNYHNVAGIYRTDYDGGYALFRSETPANNGNSLVTYTPDAADSAEGVTNYTIVEMDVAFGNVVGATAFAQLNGFAGGYRSDVYFSGTADGKVQVGHWATASDGTKPILEQNTWYNLRFEYYDGGSVKVYVDGTYACTMNGLDYGKYATSAVNIVLHQYADDEFIAYDNLYIGYGEISAN